MFQDASPRQRIVIAGGSRGVGAELARLAGAAGMDVLVSYSRRRERALALAQSIPGGNVQHAQLDIDNVYSISDFMGHSYFDDAIDVLVISVAAGMEPGRKPGYAYAANAIGPAELARRAFERMRGGGLVVLITSHEAHFYGTREAYGPYREIAESKQLGELKLLECQTAFAARDVAINIVSGELIEDSTTAKLLSRIDPGIVEARRRVVGRLPTSVDLAMEVFRVLDGPRQPSGSIFFVGDPIDYVTSK